MSKPILPVEALPATGGALLFGHFFTNWILFFVGLISLFLFISIWRLKKAEKIYKN